MKNLSIEVDNISKQYRLGKVGTGTLKNDLNKLWYSIRGLEDPYSKVGQSNDRSKKFDSDWVWALQNISFSVNQGEAISIIGKNGAGKSTLLKILSKITAPTSGNVFIKGRVSSLLEVGTGFHQDLTGRENIYMNGAILGMTKAEITKKLDDIIDFSGVEGYIDTPVKRYSSGMIVRLGFAVAANLEPDILIVDEVLAVGDAEFQRKCMGKMNDLSNKDGRTVLFVSHNMGAVKNLTSRCVYLKYGAVHSVGETGKIIETYLQNENKELINVVDSPRINEFWGKKVRIIDIKPVFEESLSFFRVFEDLSFIIKVKSEAELKDKLRFGCTISTLDGKPVASMITASVISVSENILDYQFIVKNLNLFPGSYKMSLSIGYGSFIESRQELDVVRDVVSFSVENISSNDQAIYNWQPSYGDLLHNDVDVFSIS
ncbi:MAG: ABC transporter ATP-binding protein [Chitinophagaceae bacterium]|nr:ABC transporter ATP-binding protein [Chitinophagaceae bacterium]